jgi:hypothetical protein
MGFLTKKPKNVLSKDDAKKISKEIESRELISNIAVYSMPERFRNKAGLPSDSKKSGIAVLLLGGIFLVFLGGAFYWFVIKKHDFPFFGFSDPSLANFSNIRRKVQPKNETIEENSAAKATSTPDQPEEEDNQKTLVELASETYQNYRKEAVMAKDFSAYSLIADKYGTDKLKTAVEGLRADIELLTDEQKEDFFKFIRGQMPTLKEIEENMEVQIVPGGGARVTIKGLDVSASAELVSVDGAWKVDSEAGFVGEYPEDSGDYLGVSEWISRKASEATSTPALVISVDTDSDGLTDREEAVLATDPAKADSDNDGFSDLGELRSFYNPAGKGKLSENPAIKKYSSKKSDFNFYYPLQEGWELQDVGDEQTLILKTDDNQFFQLLSQDNPEKMTIERWYKQQFGIDVIPAAKITVKRSKTDDSLLWEGIWSDDGSALYFTNPAKDLMLTLSYSNGTSDEITYPALFEMIIENFRFGSIADR